METVEDEEIDVERDSEGDTHSSLNHASLSMLSSIDYTILPIHQLSIHALFLHFFFLSLLFFSSPLCIDVQLYIVLTIMNGKSVVVVM